MISGNKIGRRQVDYYLEYVRRGGPSRWVGDGAADLGLTGAVEPSEFAALSAGSRPDGSRLLERVPLDRTPGWDFTMSAPKSVSVCWALADADLRRAIEAAHDAAVDAAVGYLESTGGRARRGLGGRDGHIPARLAVACFTHPASRESDPQLHTHSIVLNAGHGTDGRWTAIDSRTLYAHRRAAAAIYRAELRSRVAALGGIWAMPDRRGLSELAGVDRESLRVFSRRRSQIEDALAQCGRTGAAAAQAACLVTRRAKLGVELTELSAEWRSRADELSWDSGRVSRLLDGSDRRAPLDPEQRDRVERHLLGAGGLTAEAAAFTRDDVVVSWAAALAQGSERAELEALAEATLGRAEVVPLVVADSEGAPLTTANPHRRGVVRLVRMLTGAGTLVAEPRYSTTQMLSVEARLFSIAEAGRGTGVATCPYPTVASVLRARPHLSEEQADMVSALCLSGNLLDVAVGVPGSGKTFALEAARAAWLSSGYQVLGAAVAAEAAAQLEAGSGIASTTLASLLHRIAANEPLGPRSVVVVDEAGLVDTRRLARLVDAAAAAGAKVVLTGDDRQLPSVEAGGAFAALAGRLGAVRLADNGRQVAEWEQEALVALREGRAGEAAGAYARAGRMHHSDTPAVLLAQMVEGWWSAREAGEDAALLAYSRDATRLLNYMARRRLDEADRLSGPEITVAERPAADLAERSYRCGDEVVCLRNRGRLGASRDPSGLGVRNGTRGVVTAVDVETGEVTLAVTDGRSVSLPADYVGAFTDHGYALTLHKGQGRTIGQAARAGSSGEPRQVGRTFVYGADALSAEAALVAASRATDSTELFVLREPDVAETDVAETVAASWARSAAKKTATEEIETAAAIEVLAEEDPHDLLRRRADLADVIGAGPGADAVGRVHKAMHLVGLSAVELDDALTEEAAGKWANHESGSARATLAALQHRRAEIERGVTEAVAGADAAEAALAHQRSRRSVLGSDVRSAWRDIELVESALGTRRARHFDELAAAPPDYIVGLLGPAPFDPGRAQRWRQGMVEIEDYRRNRQFRPGAPGAAPLEAAMGQIPPDWWEERRYRRVAATLATVRRDLGTEAARLPIAAGADLAAGGAAAILNRSAPPPPGPVLPADGPARPIRRRSP